MKRKFARKKESFMKKNIARLLVFVLLFTWFPQVVFLQETHAATDLPTYDTSMEVIYNSPPEDIRLTNDTIDENSPIGTEIGTFSTIDPDVGDTHVYTLSGFDAGTFSISGNRLLVSGNLDYNTKNSYTITVTATDSSNNTYSQIFTIMVNKVNKPPVIQSFQINGGAPYTNYSYVTLTGTIITVPAQTPSKSDSAMMQSVGRAGSLPIFR
ncbi:cadherin repeat domain-containing protein [Paenibacillus sp. D2_2]|uniref:cadherin repeat domain-containing protein n=1 Tax=Paenibacillus sp. D2_2 TaxID=3073092 RepID=UPI002814B18F|nr:cadherin repeat domain-containing protein [Paenibacillus sp. D2_2]WMT41818.1 cadherin repeat domain-containing protein [Paenibacillus sp. D2_2]